jgi:hypothetical protein
MSTAAWLAFTQVVSCYSTPGQTPTGKVSTVGETWQPQEQKLVNGTWYLRGSSGWWPATANKSVMNGKQVTPAACEYSTTPIPCIYAKYTAPVTNTGTISCGPAYVSVMDFTFQHYYVPNS